jgi:hypothetical protein
MNLATVVLDNRVRIRHSVLSSCISNLFHFVSIERTRDSPSCSIKVLIVFCFQNRLRFSFYPLEGETQLLRKSLFGLTFFNLFTALALLQRRSGSLITTLWLSTAPLWLSYSAALALHSAALVLL